VLKQNCEMNKGPQMIVQGVQNFCKSARRDAAARNKVASQIRHELELMKKSSVIEQLECRAVALKKRERASKIISHYEVSKTNAMMKDLHQLNLRRVKLENDLIAKQEEVEAAKVKLSLVLESIKKSSEALVESNKRLKSKRALQQYYEKRASFEVFSSSNEASTLQQAIENAFTCLKGKHASTKARMLIEAIMNGSILQGEAAIVVHDIIKKFIRKLFQPWKLVKAGDVSAVGGFKTTTINTLRSVVDENGEGFFPSASTVNRSRALLDKYGSEIVGYTSRMTQYGEVYYINFEPALRLLLKACNLHDLATTTSVKVALTVDGADLFKGRTHVSTGIKVTDPRGIHPITKQPFIVSSADETDDDDYIKIQTREVCCVMIIADAKDNKHLYEEVFKDYYQWGERLRVEGLPASQFGPKLCPFIVTHTTDMKAAWFLSSRGGGCKNKTMFCHLCACTKDSLASFFVGEFRCDRCKRRDRKKCYHHTLCDSVSVPKLLRDLECKLGAYHERHGKTYQQILSTTKLRVDHMQADRETDEHHIDYIIPAGSMEKQRQYAQFIARECHLRGLQLLGMQVEEWRAMLRGSVAMEKFIAILEKIRQWNFEGQDTLPLVEVVELLIPCILHLENRVGEKMITIILRKAMNDFEGPKHDFMQRMDHVFKTKVLGSELMPSQWRLPFSKDAENNHVLDHVQVRNNVARSIIGEMDTIIEHAWMQRDTNTQQQLIIAISKYRIAMELLTAHHELSDEENEKFQDNIDDFFAIWIELFGDEGITNYIHMLGSGHILYFMKKYGCLYLYSQQGWESLNNTIQTFIHQSSQRGGFGSGEGKKNHIYIP
jgi:hypothetical protein